jgi:hypothetical protein
MYRQNTVKPFLLLRKLLSNLLIDCKPYLGISVFKWLIAGGIAPQGRAQGRGCVRGGGRGRLQGRAGGLVGRGRAAVRGAGVTLHWQLQLHEYLNTQNKLSIIC